MKKILLTLIIGCGLTPLKPLVPLGCDDLVATCVCKSDGLCEWQWICIQN